jgi:hypothetical protein
MVFSEFVAIFRIFSEFVAIFREFSMKNGTLDFALNLLPLTASYFFVRGNFRKGFTSGLFEKDLVR